MVDHMEFRRIENLPPYVFSIINGLKIEARRNGADVNMPQVYWGAFGVRVTTAMRRTLITNARSQSPR